MMPVLKQQDGVSSTSMTLQDDSRPMYQHSALNVCEEPDLFSDPKKVDFHSVPNPFCGSSYDPTWCEMDLWQQQSELDKPYYQISTSNSAFPKKSASQLYNHNVVEMPDAKDILSHVNRYPISNRKLRKQDGSSKEFSTSQRQHKDTFEHSPELTNDENLNSSNFSKSHIYENLGFAMLDNTICDASETLAVPISKTTKRRGKSATKTRTQNSSFYENDVFQRRIRDSVSSDPEIYTKSSSSSKKLDAQFKRLKEEFIALRSSTTAFQKLMDKVLQDLKWIRLIQEQRNLGWTKYREIPDPVGGFGKILEFGNPQFPSGFSKVQPKMVPFESCNVSSNAIQPSSSTYENTSPSLQASFDTLTHQNPSFQGHPVLLQQSVVERAFGESAKNRINWHFVDHGRTKLFQNSQRDRKDQLQPPRVFNDAKVKLHVSECSIDSGYQDANVLSPPEKLNRLSAAVPATHLSDNESENSLTSYETVPKELVRPTPLSTIPNVYVIHASKKKNVPSNQIDSSLPNTEPSSLYVNMNAKASDREYEVSEELNNYSHEQVDQTLNLSLLQDVNHKNLPHNRIEERAYLGEMALLDKDSPCPFLKQRTLLPTNQPKLNYVERAKHKVQQQKLNERMKKSFVKIEKILDDDFQNVRPDITPTFTHSGLSVATRHHGVSTFEKNEHSRPSTPERASGVLHSDANVVSLNQVKLRNRSSKDPKKLVVQEKQLLTSEDVVVEDKKDDFSMIRRHSMRMLQELHIFDFENFDKDQNDHGKVQSIDSKGRIQSEKIFLDELDSTNPFIASSESISTSYAVSPPFAKTFQKKLTEKTLPVNAIATTTSMPRTAVADSKISAIPYNLHPRKSVSTNLNNSQSSLEAIENFTFVDLPPVTNCSVVESASITRMSPAKFAVFVPSLIRPKPSLPGTSKSQIEAQKRTCNSLKLHPNSKSAFRPVTPSSTYCDSHKYSGSTFHSKTLENGNRQTFVELKRRTSLPCMTVSNKQRFLNEFGINSSLCDDGERERHLSGGFRDFPAESYPNEDFVDSVISTETAKVTSYKLGETPSQFTPVYHRATESYPSEIGVPPHNLIVHRRCRSADKNRSTVSLHSSRNLKGENSKPNLVDQIDATASKAIKSTTKSSQSERKIFLSWNHPMEKQRKGDMRRSTSLRRDNKKKKEDLLSSPPHLYETVNLSTELKNDALESNQRQNNKNYVNMQALPERIATKSHPKSTVALIKASLFGKLGKSNRTSRQQYKDVDKTHSHWAENASETQASRRTKFFHKEKKQKKTKNETKSQKRSLVRRLSKERSKHTESIVSSHISSPDPTLAPPADARYGNADAEVMERFLEATVAFHSNPPQSPLQRLRSSLRVTRNKHRHVHESRTKDDMEIRGMDQQQLRFERVKPTKVHNGQECTYV